VDGIHGNPVPPNNASEAEWIGNGLLSRLNVGSSPTRGTMIILCLIGKHKWETKHAPAIATWTQCERCHKQEDGSTCFCPRCRQRRKLMPFKKEWPRG
jgi:hypothetical protein